MLLLALLSAFPMGLVVAQRNGEAEPQRLRLEARNTRFNERKPTLEVRRGTPVEIVVRNTEAGAVPHDFTISGLDVRTGILQPGDSATLRLTPTRPGEYSYSCTLHPGMMDGRLLVR